MKPRPHAAVLLLALVLVGPSTHAADDASPCAAAPPLVPITEGFVSLGTREVPVEEISGLSVLPGATAERAELLVVTDEGPYDREAHEVRGALFRVPLRFTADGVEVEKPRPVVLRVRFERFDPGWPARTSPMDLEGLTPLPGHDDLFVLTGERNPEDQTDDGANRVYVVRYPDGDAGHAKVLAYLRVFDLPFDGMNDRFEGVAVLPATPAKRFERWRLYAFKERMPVDDLAPTYAHGRLAERETGFTLALAGDRGYPPLLPSRYAESPTAVSVQSDACPGPDGTIWVLDRWRRQLHVVRPAEDGRLRLERHHDLWALLRGIPGEVDPSAPPPPGLPDRKGFGRHEAVGFDVRGRLYLASDRGGGRPSTLTILRPRPRPAEAAPE